MEGKIEKIIGGSTPLNDLFLKGNFGITFKKKRGPRGKGPTHELLIP